MSSKLDNNCLQLSLQFDNENPLAFINQLWIENDAAIAVIQHAVCVLMLIHAAMLINMKTIIKYCCI